MSEQNSGVETAPTGRPVCAYDLGFEAWQRELIAHGVAAVHAAALFRALHRPTRSFALETTSFLPPLRRWVERRQAEDSGFFRAPGGVVQAVASSDLLTRKLLVELADAARIETVIMGYPGRFTACLSTQVGCAMGCGFCATGQGGFGRHLGPAEIVAQVWHAQRQLQARGVEGLRNLVLMGMGEPLHNYDAVLTALRILIDNRGVGLAPSRMTISTVGVVPGIRRLAREPEPFNLAVSLHAATQAERLSLIPVAARWSLTDLREACLDYVAETGRRIFFEWTLIAGRNDTPKQAEQVIAFLDGLESHLNLIPLNRTDGFAAQASGKTAADAFRRTVQAAGIPCTIRQRRGLDVAAGCGQLAGAAAADVAAI